MATASAVSRRERRPRLLIYPLSLAIYCTSWTFFGSVGNASRTGYEFLTIYIGPILMIGIFTPLILRVVRLAKAQNITSIADFIAARYGKSQAVAATVALIAIVGTVPYIALQLKAVSSSLGTILAPAMQDTGMLQPVFGDIALFVAVSMAAFAVLFGTRHIDATEHQDGLMLAIGAESLVKLLAFLAVGFFVTFYDVRWTGRAVRRGGGAARYRSDTQPRRRALDTLVVMTLLSFVAILLLPRQFHVTVVENNSEARDQAGALAVPALSCADQSVRGADRDRGPADVLAGAIDSDMFVLALPLQEGSALLTIAAFVGGLSAATAMVIVETVALVHHGVERPRHAARAAAARRQLGGLADFGAKLLNVRRVAIFVILLPGLRLLPLGRRRAACLDRHTRLCRHRAAGARLLRRPDVARRDRGGRHRRHDGRHPGLGLYAVAAELRRHRHHRGPRPYRRPMGHRRAAAAEPARPRPAADRARRDVEPVAQRHHVVCGVVARRPPLRSSGCRPTCSCRPSLRRSRRASGCGDPR